MPDAPPGQPPGNTPEDKKIFLIAVGLIVVLVLVTIVPTLVIMSMAPSTPKYYSVAATARQYGNNITVVWIGGRDNAFVSGYTVAIADDPSPYPGKTGGGVYYQPIVGDIHTFPGGTAGYDHVQIMAILSNGGTETVLDTYV